MWEEVVCCLPDVRIITCDKRGHGLSATPTSPWTLESLAEDVLALLDHLQIKSALIAGCSIGSLIAQAIAIKASGKVTGLFLTSSGTRAGTPESWQKRIEAVSAGGMAAVAKWVVQHWFTSQFLASSQASPWSSMVLRNDPDGYISTCRVLAETDLTAASAGIRRPSLFVVGAEDPYNPVETIRAVAARIPGANVVVLPGVAHIPALEAPEQTARLLRDFHRDLQLHQ
jgi:3-oxoadipate enol-lactonase